MKRVLKEKVAALTAFEKFCTDNSLIWSFLVAFGTAMTALRLKINSIYSTESRQEENNKGVTRTKAEIKEELANSTVAVSNAMQAFAESINNQTLFTQMGVSYSTIYYSKNEVAISSAELVLNKVNSYPIATLEPFGISQPVVDMLTEIITRYKTVAPSTRNVVTSKTVLTNNLEQLVNEGNLIMRKNLLKLGRQFKATHPNFYDGMVFNAKVIRNNIHAKIRLTVKDEITNAPLTGVLVEIVGTPLKGMTDMDGKCTITKISEGLKTVELKKTNFAVYTITDIDFKRGKAVTVTVKMQPAVIEPQEHIEIENSTVENE
jgi:hypothetical protein